MRDCRGRLPDENWIETVAAGVTLVITVAALWVVLFMIGG